jgi:hypothetical protein
MITHSLTLNIGGKAHGITIHADHVVTSETHTLFFTEADVLIAEVPNAIIIEHTEA